MIAPVAIKPSATPTSWCTGTIGHGRTKGITAELVTKAAAMTPTTDTTVAAVSTAIAVSIRTDVIGGNAHRRRPAAEPRTSITSAGDAKEKDTSLVVLDEPAQQREVVVAERLDELAEGGRTIAGLTECGGHGVRRPDAPRPATTASPPPTGSP